MFDFRLDADARIIRIKLKGFWDQKEAQDYSAAYLRHADQARARWDRVRILTDASEVPVQPAEVTKEFEGLSRATLRGTRDRVAIVVNSSLRKMQVMRLLEVDTTPDIANVFTSMADAEAWLRRDD